MEHVSFVNRNGINLAGILEKISPEDKFIVVLCHGLNSNKNSRKYIDLANMLAKRNISSFRFDFFSHGDSDGEFNDFTFEEGKENIVDAIHFLKSKGFSEFILFGNSFGGICTLEAATELSALKAIALSAPGSSRDYSDVYEKTKKISVPVLIVHGQNDETVPLEKTKKFRDFIPNLTLKIIKNADHRFTRSEHYNQLLKEVILFIEKNI